jgi:hypothetical protein
VSSVTDRLKVPVQVAGAFFARWEVTLRGWADQQRSYTLPLFWLGLAWFVLFLGVGQLHLWHAGSGSTFAAVAERIVRGCEFFAIVGFLAVAGLALRQRRNRGRERN